jgi:hypothetical protein
MAALLGESTAVDHQDPIGGPQVPRHCFPVLVQPPLIGPPPFPDEGRQGPYRRGHDAFHRQHQRLYRFARQRRQQPLEIDVRRLPLFTPLTQGAVEGVIGAQFLPQGLNGLDRQIHLGRGLDQVSHSALLPLLADGQNDTTFRSLVVVLKRISK